MTTDALREKFGKRIQRCYGCFIAYHLKDLWLAEGGTFYCENCKDEDMFHFDDYSVQLDLSKMPSLQQPEDTGGHSH